jgi:hypothetical protein
MANSGKIFPRNLTARAAYQAAGNPDSTRPEDSVGNFYPGLDTDLRNLDRRFFPGLVFNFVARRDIDAPYTDKLRYGALLAYTDPWGDTDLQPETVARLDASDRIWVEPLAGPLLSALTGDQGALLATGEWYLDWIEQGGNRLGMMQVLPDGSPSGLDGLFVWRLVRGLERGPVTIALSQRDGRVPPIVLHGWRRFYTNSRTGVLSTAYQPGELTQALCSPWQHDFRDCSCHYWPANRPDLVHAFAPSAVGSGDDRDVERAAMLVDWLRADRAPERAGAALNTMPINRPYQMDYYQISRTWQDLSIVVGNTEIGSRYVPPAADTAEPFASPDELAAALRDLLAPVEMMLAVQYLYARFSLLTREEATRSPWAELADDVTFARHMLMLTAASEMQHLRWTNELLWALADAGLVHGYSPILTPAERVPVDRSEALQRQLRRLDREALAEFITIEAPQGAYEANYARVIVTLRGDHYPRHLSDMASRIVNDGVQHFYRLRDVRGVLSRYDNAKPPYPYLREIRPGTPEETAAALAAYRDIVAKLSQAYALLWQGGFAAAAPLIAAARVAMNTLLDEGERLAAQGIGIPFW